jgi:hypothetical protein
MGDAKYRNATASDETMLHALGSSRATRQLGSRNYFCTKDGDPELELLVSQGLMQLGPTINDGRDRYYYVTTQGKDYLRQKFGVAIDDQKVRL